jgi:hypothetical protein
MLKPHMHFEQVPIETVRKIMERQIEEEKAAVLRLVADRKTPQENTDEPISVMVRRP